MRHITLSAQKGMGTELELMGGSFGTGELYKLRYHRAASNTADMLDAAVPGARTIWSGFRYRNNEVSILLASDARSSATA
jgi:hypothetical protein